MSREKQRLPDFFIVGAAKSGTASLCKYLEQHPRIEIVSTRLEHFGEYTNPAVKSLTDEEYLRLFHGIDSSIKAGEKSVSYMYSDLARQQIASLCPDATIIMLLRNPIERAYSDYWHRVRTGVEQLSFESALEEEEARIRRKERFELHYKSYGLYSRRVHQYIDQFGRENVGVYLYDDFREDPLSTVRSIFHLLAVDDQFVPDDMSATNIGGRGSSNYVVRSLFRLSRNKYMVAGVNAMIPRRLKARVTGWMNSKSASVGYPEMSENAKKLLADAYRDDVEMLSKILDRDLSDWLR